MVMGREEALGKARPAVRKEKCGLNSEMWATGVQNLNRNKFRKGGAIGKGGVCPKLIRVE